MVVYNCTGRGEEMRETVIRTCTCIVHGICMKRSERYSQTMQMANNTTQHNTCHDMYISAPSGGIRIHDFSLPRQVLYQLSYRGSSAGRLVGGESHNTKHLVKQFNTQSDLNKH